MADDAEDVYERALSDILAAGRRTRRFDLSDRGLTALPPEIARLTALQGLDLSGNKLATLPLEITQLTALDELRLSKNQFKYLPPETLHLTGLRSLSLSLNPLSVLTPDIALLTELRSLSLTSTNITTLPPELTHLSKLVTLYVMGNRLTELPRAVIGLPGLRELYLNGNELTALPPEIIHLNALVELDVASNKLTTLPPEITHLTKLRDLDVSGNPLTALPPEISQLTNLRFLGLSFIDLVTLPPEITHLTSLRSLNLSHNQLATLPPGIGRLTALKRLNLSSNRLTALPVEIARLTALERLDLSLNQLTALPTGLGGLSTLTRAAEEDTKPFTEGLSLEENPLPAPYPRLIAPGQPAATRDVLAYLRGELELAVDDPLPDDGAEAAPPSIPPPRPAAIRVAFVNDRLALTPAASPADLDGATMRAAIAALKSSMTDLLQDASAETSNFDRRALRLIERARERMPEQDMPTATLFQLAHLHEVLGKYAKTVADEWPELLVAQFGVVLLNLDRLIARFPEWQAFIAQVAPGLSREQAGAAPAISEAMAEELRSEEAKAFVDEAIPQALDDLAALQAMMGDDALDLLAPDILEAINNILKPIAAIALQAWSAAASLVGEMATAFGGEARKGAVEAAGNVGKAFAPWVVKWARRVLTIGTWGGGGYGAATLAQIYPGIFGWLEPIVTALLRLG